METLVLGNDREEDELLPKDCAFESESEEEDGAEEDNHEKLLHVIQSLAKKKRPEQRDEPSLEVSEFHFSRRDDGSRLDARDLLVGIKGAKQLKQRLDKVERKAKQVSVPLPKLDKERIHRKVAYEQTSTQVSKWEPIVKHNAKAEHLSFPMQSERLPPPSLNSRAESYQPVTELERAVSRALDGCEHVVRRGEQLSEAERTALLEMSLEEARARRKELQRVRALMSYYELKCKRWKKIKSKGFRKIRRKRREREDARAAGGEEVLGRLERAERLRAQERATLKHTRKSKWAREQLSRNHRDPAVQLALAEQGTLKQELKQKAAAIESEDSDRNLSEESDAEDPRAAGVTDEDIRVGDPSNPWLIDRNPRKTNTVPPDVRLDEDAGLRGRQSEEKASGSILNLREQGRRRRAGGQADETDSYDDSANQDRLIETCGGPDSDAGAPSEDLRCIRSETATALSDIPWDNQLGGDVAGGRETAGNSVTGEGGHIDPRSFMLTEDGCESSFAEANRQLLAVHEAFAGDDVVEQFVKEKADAVSASLPKVVDSSLPGWGSWGGLGTHPPRKKSKPAKEPATARPRKDDGKNWVIVSEETDTKAAKHQVAEIPYPYANRARFRRAMARPIGRLWNSETAFTELIKPKIQTATGTVIEPMKLTDEVQEFMRKTEVDSKREGEEVAQKDSQGTASPGQRRKKRLRNAKKKTRKPRDKTVRPKK